MITSIKAQIEDWKYGREIIKSFVLQLGDEDLDKLLPRKKLNTIRKQCEELILTQKKLYKCTKNKENKF